MIVRSGTFTIHNFKTLDPTWFFDPSTPKWYCTLLGPPVPTDYVAIAAGSALLDTTTEGINLNWNPSPSGFTPTTNCRVNIALGGFGGGGGPSVGTAEYSSVSFTLGDPNPDANKFADNPAYGALFSFLRIRITAHGSTDSPFELTNASGLQSNVTVTGNYDIVYYWWTIPAVSPCGDRQTPHYKFLPAGEDPGAPWVRLDPANPNAAPAPVVLAVTPNHGAVAGGTAVTITGSGFGNGGTVAFAGVAATSVVVVSQAEITCVAPAHAAGSTTVVVTNPDRATS